MRATDIVMDRVWQLDVDHFGAESDFIFAPMSMTVHLADDPEALHPEIQQQVTGTRTDLDRSSIRSGLATTRRRHLLDSFARRGFPSGS